MIVPSHHTRRGSRASGPPVLSGCTSLAGLLALASCVPVAAKEAPAAPAAPGAPHASSLEGRGGPGAWLGDFPIRRLASEHLSLTVALPDPEAGFNRATRFDRAGVVVEARTADGRHWFGPVVDPALHDPLADDHVAGTAGEFGIREPPGYADAAPGGAFLKIGVGLLQRDAKPYFFRKTYPVLDPGVWTVRTTEDAVEAGFEVAAAEPGGLACRYTTRVRLLPERAGFAVERELTNTGGVHIATSHYAHNFFTLGGEPAAVGTRLELGRTHAAAADLPAGLALDGRTLRVAEPLQGPSAYLELEPTGPGEPAYRLASAAGDRAVTVRTRPPADRLVVYLDQRAFSVEPFFDIDLAPGASTAWETIYEFE